MMGRTMSFSAFLSSFFTSSLTRAASHCHCCSRSGIAGTLRSSQKGISVALFGRPLILLHLFRLQLRRPALHLAWLSDDDDDVANLVLLQHPGSLTNGPRGPLSRSPRAVPRALLNTQSELSMYA